MKNKAPWHQYLSNFWMGISGGVVQLFFVTLTGLLIIIKKSSRIAIHFIGNIDTFIRGSIFVVIVILLGIFVEMIWAIRKLYLMSHKNLSYSLAKRQIAREVILFNQALEEKDW